MFDRMSKDAVRGVQNAHPAAQTSLAVAGTIFVLPALIPIVEYNINNPNTVNDFITGYQDPSDFGMTRARNLGNLTRRVTDEIFR